LGRTEAAQRCFQKIEETGGKGAPAGKDERAGAGKPAGVGKPAGRGKPAQAERVGSKKGETYREWALLQRADLACESGDYRRAGELYDEFLKRYPGSLSASPVAEFAKAIRAEGEKRQIRLSGPLPRISGQGKNFCGPIALQFVMNYHGYAITQKEIAREIVLSREGMTNFTEVIRFADGRGFRPIAVLADLSTLKSTLQAGLPIFVFTTMEGQGHLTTVIGFDEGRSSVLLFEPGAPGHVVASPWARFSRALRFTGRIALVVVPVKIALERDLRDLPAARQIVKLYLAAEKGEIEKALSFLESLKGGIAPGFYHLMRGDLFRAGGDDRKSHDEYKRIRWTPEEAGIVGYRLGRASMNLGRYPEACSYLTKVAAREGIPEADYYLAVCYRMMEEYETAASHFERAIASERARDSLKALAYLGLGESCGLMGKEVRALRALAESIAIVPNPQVGSAYRLRSTLYFNKAMYTEALRDALKAERLGEGGHSLHRLIGHVYLETGEHKKAVARLEKALEGVPEDVLVHFAIAKARLGLGDVDGAIRALKVVLAITPRDSSKHLDLGKLYFRKERFREALREFRKAADLSPGSAVAFQFMGDVMLRLNRPGEAARHFKKALAINPNLQQAHYGLGYIYGKKGMTRSAIESYETVLKLDPRHGGAHRNLALLYFQAGFYKRAREHAEKARRMGAEPPEELIRAIEEKLGAGPR
jgi:tetratricopeptide (TPR) repeat protein